MPAHKNIDVEALKRDHAAGLSPADLAKKYALTYSAVYYHLKRSGIPRGGARPRVARTSAALPRKSTGGNADTLWARVEDLLDAEWAKLDVHQKCEIFKGRVSAV